MAPNPLERIRELSIHDGNEDLSAYESVKYEWAGGPDGSGYEVFETKLRDGAAVHYRGVFHPDEGYCDGNPCRYCGHTVIE